MSDTVTNRLRELREKADLSVDELAHRANLSTFTIYRLEVGAHTPSRKTRRAIAEALAIPSSEIFPENGVRGSEQ